jgi:hypothetical protein
MGQRGAHGDRTGAPPGSVSDRLLVPGDGPMGPVIYSICIYPHIYIYIYIYIIGYLTSTTSSLDIYDTVFTQACMY